MSLQDLHFDNNILRVDEDLNTELLEDHEGERTGWYFVSNKQYLLPSRIATEMKDFHSFSVRTDDIWISTFPRSGTTLTQELVWILVNNFDFESAKEKLLWDRSPFFELCLFFHEETKQMLLKENIDNPENRNIIETMSRPGYETINELASPRVIKTHFPPSLLPVEVHQMKAKIIYVARNPKDVVISFYYLLRLWRTSGYAASFKKFWHQFKNGYVPWGPYWTHVLEGWTHRNDANVLFLFYEDMMKDLTKAIHQIATFLQTPAPPDQIRRLVDHLDIRTFSNNPVVNFEGMRQVGILNQKERSFVRKGNRRERSEEFTEEIENEIDDWISKNHQETDLRFPRH